MLVNRDEAQLTEIEGVPSAETASASVAAPAPTVTVIEPHRGWVSLQFDELWKFRELLLFIAWRDVKVRYQQTFFGVAWAVLQPLFMMLVFSVFFGRFAKLPSDGIPYPVFTLCAVIPWQLFQYSLSQSS